MTQTKTDTQKPIFTEVIVEPQQTDNTRTFTELLQGDITSLQPPSSNDASSLAVGVVPCADPVPAYPNPDLASASAPPSASFITPTTVPTSPSNPIDPFSIYQKPLTTATPQPVHWLWQHRLPLAGITLLDGDHKLGKTLLAHQIAAAVSSGSPMPDGTPTIQGNVIIITPDTDATTTQLQQLTNLGADLSHIQILTYIQDPASSTHPSRRRPFCLPEDLPLLFDTIDQFNTRLIILDPFIDMLSKQRRWTTRHLNHLLSDLNQRLIERRVACLLVRNCHARGGQAKPTTLERCDHFPIIAISHLLLAPDPIQPNRLLLSHALNRHGALTPTLSLHIQSLPINPNLAHFTVTGTHCLTATHLLTRRPDTLHRQLLSQHLYSIIAHATEPIAATTLSAQSPHSSTFQVQRSLKDLLQTGHILRPARGFYSLNSDPPTKLNSPAATTITSTTLTKLNSPAATTITSTTPTTLNSPAATTITSTTPTTLDSPAATTPYPPNTIKLAATTTTQLESTAAITFTPTMATKLNAPAATTPIPTKEPQLDSPAATTPARTKEPELNATAATTSTPTTTSNLNITAATTPTPTITTKLNTTVTTTPKSKTPRPHKHPSKHKKWHGRPGQSKKRS